MTWCHRCLSAVQIRRMRESGAAGVRQTGLALLVSRFPRFQFCSFDSVISGGAPSCFRPAGVELAKKMRITSFCLQHHRFVLLGGILFRECAARELRDCSCCVVVLINSVLGAGVRRWLK